MAKLQIIRIFRDMKGSITHLEVRLKLEDALELRRNNHSLVIQHGELPEVKVEEVDGPGHTYLRSLPNGVAEDNLGNLPAGDPVPGTIDGYLGDTNRP